LPTVMFAGPYRFHFYSNERQEPPHIHVDFQDNDVKFWLDPVRLARNKGVPIHKLRMIERLVRDHAIAFKEKYDEYHGR